MCVGLTSVSFPAFTWDGAHGMGAVCVHTARVQWVDPTEHGSSGSYVCMEGTRKFILKTLEVSYKKRHGLGFTRKSP